MSHFLDWDWVHGSWFMVKFMLMIKARVKTTIHLRLGKSMGAWHHSVCCSLRSSSCSCFLCFSSFSYPHFRSCSCSSFYCSPSSSFSLSSYCFSFWYFCSPSRSSLAPASVESSAPPPPPSQHIMSPPTCYTCPLPSFARHKYRIAKSFQSFIRPESYSPYCKNTFYASRCISPHPVKSEELSVFIFSLYELHLWFHPLPSHNVKERVR